MVTDEVTAKAVGPWVFGAGAVMFVTGLAWLAFPNATDWQYISVALMACSFPVLVAYALYLAVWVAREWPRPAPPTKVKETERAMSAPATKDFGPDWYAAAHHFVQWGDAQGFPCRHLAREYEGEPDKCISWDGWGLMRAYLIEAGVLTGGGQDTRWADDWDLARWVSERHSLALPHRTFAPPTVSIFVRHYHNNSSHNAQGEGQGREDDSD